MVGAFRRGGNGVKLNLHFRLASPGEKWARDFNARLCEATTSSIDFSAGMIPHLTLAMGDLAPGRRVEDLADRIGAQLAGTSLRLDARATALHLDPRDRSYVFLDLEPHPELTALKADLAALLMGEWLVSDRRYSSAPHITLGHVAPEDPAAADLIAATALPVPLALEVVALGEVAARGAVRNRLFAWP